MVKKSEIFLHVSPDGNSGAPGTEKFPLATLEDARNRIQQLPPGHGPVTVFLHNGVYYRTEPFILKPEDSGTEDAPVTYTAVHPGKVIISGGKRITEWRQKEDSSLWIANIGKWKFNQLFINGRRRPRARLPIQGYFKVRDTSEDDEGWAGLVKKSSLGEPSCNSFCYIPEDIHTEWADRSDLEVVVLQFWTAARLRIKSIDDKKCILYFTGSSFRPLSWSFGYYLDNIKEGLVAPGTWYIDSQEGLLYYHPMDGETIENIEAYAPVARQLVKIEGDIKQGLFVKNIIFRGLSFQYTEWLLPKEGYSYHQAELPALSAFSATGAHNCRLENCEFSHLGGWAVEWGKGCCNNLISRNKIWDLGAGCIKIGSEIEPSTLYEESCGNEVSDTLCKDGSAVYLGSPAIWIGFSSDNTIKHNEISGAFHWGISVGWRWSYFPLSSARNNLIEYNHIHHLGTGILGTHGALYFLGTSPGTMARNNYIHHIYSNEHWGAGEGIILDNGCAGILIENNIVHDADAGGWGCNFNCFGNIIQNNIFAYGKKYQLTRYGDPPHESTPNGEIFTRNIIVWKEGPLFKEDDWWAYQTLWDYNLYWYEGEKPMLFLKYSFKEWQEKGMDVHSIIADPQFLDTDTRDFRLDPTSPVFKIGFKSIDMSTVGPRFPFLL